MSQHNSQLWLEILKEIMYILNILKIKYVVLKGIFGHGLFLDICLVGLANQFATLADPNIDFWWDLLNRSAESCSFQSQPRQAWRAYPPGLWPASVVENLFCLSTPQVPPDCGRSHSSRHQGSHLLTCQSKIILDLGYYFYIQFSLFQCATFYNLIPDMKLCYFSPHDAQEVF